MSQTTTNLTFLNLLQELRALGEFVHFAHRTWTQPIGKADQEDARSVLLIPGFLAGDPVLYPFSHWLRACGHRVFFPGILTNMDCPRHAIDRLSRILSDFSDQAQDKLVVIGHSLGGIYARELARRFPDRVEQVILLGAPIKEPLKHSNPYVRAIASLTRRVHESTRGCEGELATVCGVNLAEPPPGVPETLIYSKSDGVVDWMSCIESGPDVEAIEVQSTHCGLPYNLEAMRIIRERLERRGRSAGRTTRSSHPATPT